MTLNNLGLEDCSACNEYQLHGVNEFCPQHQGQSCLDADEMNDLLVEQEMNDPFADDRAMDIFNDK